MFLLFYLNLYYRAAETNRNLCGSSLLDSVIILSFNLLYMSGNIRNYDAKPRKIKKSKKVEKRY